MNHLMTDESIVLISCMTFGVILAWDSLKRRYRTYPPWFYVRTGFCFLWISFPIIMLIGMDNNPIPLVIASSLFAAMLILLFNGIKWINRDYQRWLARNHKI